MALWKITIGKTYCTIVMPRQADVMQVQNLRSSSNGFQSFSKTAWSHAYLFKGGFRNAVFTFGKDWYYCSPPALDHIAKLSCSLLPSHGRKISTVSRSKNIQTIIWLFVPMKIAKPRGRRRRHLSLLQPPYPGDLPVGRWTLLGPPWQRKGHPSPPVVRGPTSLTLFPPTSNFLLVIIY